MRPSWSRASLIIVRQLFVGRKSEVVRGYGVPVGDLLAIDQLEVSLPEITHHLYANVSNVVGRVNGGGSGARRVAYLAARKAPNRNDHFVGESKD